MVSIEQPVHFVDQRFTVDPEIRVLRLSVANRLAGQVIPGVAVFLADAVMVMVHEIARV